MKGRLTRSNRYGADAAQLADRLNAMKARGAVLDQLLTHCVQTFPLKNLGPGPTSP
jgi:hypothetical protein